MKTKKKTKRAHKKSTAAAKNVAKFEQKIQAYSNDTSVKFDGLDESIKTQGKAGQKLPRINMAFSQANYDYIKVMAGLEGTTMTHFLNRVIDAYRKDNSQHYILAKKLQQIAPMIQNKDRDKH